MHRLKTMTAAGLTALAVPAAAQAHVTVQPNEAPAGAYTVEAVRVPNESDSAATTKVELKFPDGFAAASYAAQPGWKVSVKTKKLATPVQTDDGEITEGVDTITWTADSKADGVQPGQFKDFPISVQIPGKAGDTLTFKAIQTYSDGEVARWIGAESSDKPAPTVKVTAADGEDHSAMAGGKAESTSAPATPATTIVKKEESKGLSIAALIVGLLGLGAGGAGLAAARKRA